MDRSPAEVVATLLDEEVYLCSERTMYRVLASEVPVQERRAQRTHPEYKKPELMATAPNQVKSRVVCKSERKLLDASVRLPWRPPSVREA